MLELFKAAQANSAVIGLVVTGLSALVTLSTRLAVQKLHTKLLQEQEARCQFCESVRFEPRRSAVRMIERTERAAQEATSEKRKRHA